MNYSWTFEITHAAVMVPVKLVVVVISIIHVPNSLEFKDFEVRSKSRNAVGVRFYQKYALFVHITRQADKTCAVIVMYRLMKCRMVIANLCTSIQSCLWDFD